MLTHDRLREVLSYDPETGVFTWLSGRRKGQVAGGIRADGYRHIQIGVKKFFAQRLAWLYVTGGWPAGQVDHRDGVRDSNAFGNLREATRSQNAHNQHRAQRNSQSKLLGASWYGRDSNWRAKIVVGGKQKHLGYFATPEAAHECYLRAKAVLHPFSTLAGRAS